MPYIRRTKLITKSNDHRAPNNIRYDPVLRKTISRLCQCPPPPPPITRSYTTPGSFVDILSSLPPGYVWQVVGIVLGGGGGGGGGAQFQIFGPGLAGSSGSDSTPLAFTNLVSGGTILTSSPGGGGGGGDRGINFGDNGDPGSQGSSSSIVSDSLVVNTVGVGGLGGAGGIGNGNPFPQPSGNQPGNGGGGGGGFYIESFPPPPQNVQNTDGSPGISGSVTFTATPIRQ